MHVSFDASIKDCFVKVPSSLAEELIEIASSQLVLELSWQGLVRSNHG